MLFPSVLGVCGFDEYRKEIFLPARRNNDFRGFAQSFQRGGLI